MKKSLLIIPFIAILPFLAACSCEKCVPAGTQSSAENTVPAENTAPAESAVPAEPSVPVAESHPYLNQPFEVRWSELTNSAIVPDVKFAIARADKKIDEIASQPLDNLTYESTIDALYRANAEFDWVWGLIAHLESVRMSPEFRAAYAEVLPLATEFGTRQGMNEKLWNVLKAYSQTKDAKTLPPEKARHLNKVLDGFRDSGADLPDDKKAELSKLITELTTISQNFSQNMLDATNAVEIVVTDPARLKGIPENAVAAALATAKEKGKATDEKPAWVFTLQYISSAPVLSYAEDASLRKEVWQASDSLCIDGKYDNAEIMKRILELRQREAELLGKNNFSDFILQHRMAGSGENAYKFVQELVEKTRAPFNREYEELKAFRKSIDKNYDGGLFEPWEISYWSEKMRTSKFDFDPEAAKPYFPMEHVLTGMFGLVEQLYGIEIREEKSIYIEVGSGKKAPAGTHEVWHPEVKYYSIYDRGNGKKLGSFYSDWYPRESKRAGAWMNYLKIGERANGKFEPHLGLVCGNLTAPVGDTPALLTHLDVETIFHEFGHLLHHILGNSSVPALGGTNVAWDFVELPSQIMENWTWEPEILSRFAKHYKTGEPLPQDMLNKMLAARNFQSANRQMRQLRFANDDLYIHIHAKELAGKNINDFCRELSGDFVWETKTKSNTNMNRFGHLFRDPVAYASGYYSYKWAEMLEADAFTVFKKPDGTIDFSQGMNFRKKLLEKGDTEEPAKLFRDFVGRDPNPDALLIREGLLEKPEAK